MPEQPRSVNSALVSGGLLLAAIVVNIVGNLTGRFLFGWELYNLPAQTWYLALSLVLDIGFIAAVYLRSVTPGRRAPAVGVALLATATGTGIQALWYLNDLVGIPIPPFLSFLSDVWVIYAGMVLYVAAWGIARRRYPLWTVGLVPASVIAVVYGLLESSGWLTWASFGWPVLWWGALALGCLACWGFDAIAGASRSAAALRSPAGAAVPAPIGHTTDGQPIYPVVGYTPDGKPVTADRAVGLQQPVAATGGTNSMSIVALITGLTVAPLGIIFGHIALSQINRTGQEGRGFAIAGLVLGYLGLASWIALVIFWIVMLNGVL